VIRQLYYEVNAGIYGQAWDLITSLSIRITGTSPTGPTGVIGPTGPYD
jgi:hypothetical protein